MECCHAYAASKYICWSLMEQLTTWVDTVELVRLGQFPAQASFAVSKAIDSGFAVRHTSTSFGRSLVVHNSTVLKDRKYDETKYFGTHRLTQREDIETYGTWVILERSSIRMKEQSGTVWKWSILYTPDREEQSSLVQSKSSSSISVHSLVSYK